MKLRNPRKIAWEAIQEFEKKQTDPDQILGSLIDPAIQERDKALAWEITKGTIRYLRKLDYIAQSFVKAPISRQKPKVLASLRIGLYQLLEMSGIPSFAAVDQTVRLVSDEGMKRDAGFVNAILRSFLREPDKVQYPDRDKDQIAYLSIYYSYPEWLVRRWHARYGFAETEKMLVANNCRPKTFFRVIMSKTDRSKVLEELKKEAIEVDAAEYFPEFISTNDGSSIIKSRLFKEGFINVQDLSQGLPVHLLNPQPGDEVLDLCSAPGGKTIAIADQVGPEGKVISLDKDNERLKQVRENATRIGFTNIEFIASDLLEIAPDKKYKFILLDVPCSGLGTLAQNVDLRWTKKEKDIKALSAIQSRIIKKAVNLLADGGCLVYSTCTTEPDEIENVIDGLLKTESGIRLENNKSELLAPFAARPGIYRTWPHKHKIGGGGFALLRKNDG
jgi:16S rRNA (cytosine967-C5)-methyltransferase